MKTYRLNMKKITTWVALVMVFVMTRGLSLSACAESGKTEGVLYAFDEQGHSVAAQFSSDVFDGETDPLEKRHYLMPTLVQTSRGEVLYVLVSKRDSPTEYELHHFNVTDGTGGRIKIDNVLCIAD